MNIPCTYLQIHKITGKPEVQKLGQIINQGEGTLGLRK